MKRMTEKKRKARKVYYGPGDTKEKVARLVKAGLSRSYAYELLGRLEILYMLQCFE